MSDSSDDSILTYRYTFTVEDGTERQFEVRLDYDTLAMRVPERADPPDWTRLDFHRCSNCPLDPAIHPRCPVAMNLVDLVESFRDMESYDRATVRVEARNRHYLAETSLQKGIGALIGLVMVTSGCPIMNRLRPMVDTHLPFMTLEESTYRLISMYLTAQHFVKMRGGVPDWDLSGLVELLAETHEVNVGFTRRLRALQVRDASLNAVVNLNASSSFISTAMESNWLARFESIFVDHAGWGAGRPRPGSRPAEDGRGGRYIGELWRPPKMKLTERRAGDVTIVDLSGRILFADGEEDFRAGLRPIIESGCVNLVLNMIDVPFIDSAGIGELIRTHTTLSRKGGRLKLVHLSRRVYEALMITQLLTVIEAFDTEEEALASFGKS